MPAKPKESVAKTSFRVGVRLTDWAQGFGNRIYGGILDFIRSGVQFELEFEQPSGGDIEPVKLDKHWDGDGLLVFRYTQEEAEAWSARGIRVVNLSSEEPSKGPVFPRVTMDNQRCGRMAADHLLTLGLKRFAFWHDPNRVYSDERLEGFRQRLAEEGHEVEILSIPSSTFPKNLRARQIEEMGKRQIGRLQPPCGLFAKDDITAVCAIRAARQCGLRVPQDIPVLGVSDDIVYCHATRPPISSLRFPGRAIGQAASELLHRMMCGESFPSDTRIKIPSLGVVVRESTGHVELPDPIVSAALNLIRKSDPKEPLTAEELGRRVGASREALRVRFREALGRTPKEEIDRIRAEHACELLKRTNATLQKIASDCGFNGSDEFCRFFKRVKGVTPGTWRST
ncbi:XylR family transcriptional regulator [Luteolibacter sp. LG18]|uniref:XylR family transcriptional regulator n=1 Tax=Luteolibacter sp. LG18 TaxID=2819286 RepID=UPI002B2AC6A3|nr:XylR family transcriptional regulator [Luteolibacter sp. LG18]